MIEFTADFDRLMAKITELGEVPRLNLNEIAKDAAQEALNSISEALQPVKSEFQGRKGRTAESSHQGGNLKDLLKLRKGSSKKGKTIYFISTTWYAQFKDRSFTTHSGRKIDGSKFITGVMESLEKGLKEQMELEVVEKIRKVCES